ncbi:hypothetical protein GOBAR_AA08651 [Gossypium barbadense]|uniref:Uncharacterized protein n=1 Tax=Gossypium barbadense TaxID=3634 RepID=A0A2P5Y8T3_GOSBA|nr:hypothetical protein GOBAR_AA08651 [Gossypium barbadense]
MSPMGIDYARRYGMPVPNPLPNKYPPMQYYGQVKYEEWKENMRMLRKKEKSRPTLTTLIMRSYQNKHLSEGQILQPEPKQSNPIYEYEGYQDSCVLSEGPCHCGGSSSIRF